MPFDNDGLSPTGDASRNVLDYDWFTENETATDISDCTIGRLSHLLEFELLNACLKGFYGCTFNSDLASFDSVFGVNSDLVIGSITFLDAQIEVLDVWVQVRQDEFIFYDVPDDSSHLITVHLNYRVFDFDSSFHEG